MRHIVMAVVAAALPTILACGGLGSDLPNDATEATATSRAEATTSDGPPTAADEATVTARTTAGPGTATATVTTSSGVTASDKPTATAPSGEREYPGTWLGVCERMASCGCNPMTTTSACARAMETAYEEGMSLARAMGTPAGMLALAEMNEDRLFMAANSPCSVVCSEMAQYGGGDAKPAPAPAGGADVRIDMQAGPGGASIHVEDEVDW